MDKGWIEIFRESRFFASKEIWGTYNQVHVHINRKNIVQILQKDETKWDKVQQYKINKGSTKVSIKNRKQKYTLNYSVQEIKVWDSE